MCVCMYVCVCVCVCVYVCICVYICVCYAFVYMCVCICMCVYVCVCMCICVYVCGCIYYYYYACPITLGNTACWVIIGCTSGSILRCVTFQCSELIWFQLCYSKSKSIDSIKVTNGFRNFVWVYVCVYVYIYIYIYEYVCMYVWCVCIGTYMCVLWLVEKQWLYYTK